MDCKQAIFCLLLLIQCSDGAVMVGKPYYWNSAVVPWDILKIVKCCVPPDRVMKVHWILVEKCEKIRQFSGGHFDHNTAADFVDCLLVESTKDLPTPSRLEGIREECETQVNAKYAGQGLHPDTLKEIVGTCVNNASEQICLVNELRDYRSSIHDDGTEDESRDYEDNPDCLMIRIGNGTANPSGMVWLFDKVEVTCNDGYYFVPKSDPCPSDDRKFKCLGNNTFNHTITDYECLPACPPYQPQNRGVVVSPQGNTAICDTITAECGPGFRGGPATTLTCNKDGSYTGTEPECYVDCIPINIPNSINSITGNVQEDQTNTITCQPGYTLTRNANSSNIPPALACQIVHPPLPEKNFTCTSLDTYNEVLSVPTIEATYVCEPDCPLTPTLPANAEFSETSPISWCESAIPECKDGFDPIGAEGTPEYFCTGRNGSLVPPDPITFQCTSPCPPETIENGQVTPSNPPDVNNGETAAVTCNPGFTLAINETCDLPGPVDLVCIAGEYVQTVEQMGLSCEPDCVVPTLAGNVTASATTVKYCDEFQLNCPATPPGLFQPMPGNVSLPQTRFCIANGAFDPPFDPPDNNAGFICETTCRIGDVSRPANSRPFEETGEFIPIGSTLPVVCNENHDLINVNSDPLCPSQQTPTCEANNNFVPPHSDLRCVPRCPTIVDIPGTIVEPELHDDNRFSLCDTLNVTCPPGFVLQNGGVNVPSGSFELECILDPVMNTTTRWSSDPAALTCTQECMLPTLPVSSEFNPSPRRGPYLEGEQYVVVCDDGQSLIAEGECPRENQTITCENGNFQPDISGLKCVESCGPLPTIANSEIVSGVTTDNDVCQEVTLRCKQFFQLQVNGVNHVSDTVTITCSVTSFNPDVSVAYTPDPTSITCVAECVIPPALANGFVSPSSGNTLGIGQTYTWGCNQGYTPARVSDDECVTPQPIECVTNGEFNEVLASTYECSPDCSALGSLPSNVTVVAPGDVNTATPFCQGLTLECANGFYATGSGPTSTLLCTDADQDGDSEFVPSLSTAISGLSCRRVCERPSLPPPLYGMLTPQNPGVLVEGDMLTLRCQQGRSLIPPSGHPQCPIDEEKITCESDGYFSPGIGGYACVERCGNYNLPDNSITRGSSNNIEVCDEFTVKCRDNYQLLVNGQEAANVTVTCNLPGPAYSPPAAQLECKRICDEITLENGVVMPDDGSLEGETTMLRCEEGFSLAPITDCTVLPKQNVTCLPDGTYSAGGGLDYTTLSCEPDCRPPNFTTIYPERNLLITPDTSISLCEEYLIQCPANHIPIVPPGSAPPPLPLPVKCVHDGQVVDPGLELFPFNCVCEATIDICIAMDGSDSINSAEFELQKNVVKGLGNGFNFDAAVGAGVGSAIFAREVAEKLPLTYVRQDYDNGVDSIQQDFVGLGVRTNIGRGLLECRDIIDASTRTTNEKLIILITDGTQTIPQNPPIAVAAMLKSQGFLLATIGIGDETSPTVLQAMASGGVNGAPRLYFPEGSFQEALANINTINNQICQTCHMLGGNGE